jgi:hypothetical protein
LQAQERVHRIGQTKEVNIYRLITQDTVEEIVLRRSLRKLQLSLNLIEKGDFGRGIEADDISMDDMFDMIKYGLHKVIKNATTDDDDDTTLLNMDIDTILQNGEVSDLCFENLIIIDNVF